MASNVRDAVALGGLREVREQDRGDPEALVVLVDLERDLGPRRAHPHVGGVADDPLRPATATTP